LAAGQDGRQFWAQPWPPNFERLKKQFSLTVREKKKLAGFSSKAQTLLLSKLKNQIRKLRFSGTFEKIFT